jgi:hypothetical protein
MLESLFLAIAEAVFSYVIEKFDPVQQIKKWLRREPATVAFQKALARTYSAFARQYPDYTAALFDQNFLVGAGAPEIAKLLTRHLHPDPALFAHAWADSLGLDQNSTFREEAIKLATDFLKWLEADLKHEVVFQPIFDSRALESLSNLEKGIEKLTRELKHSLDESLKIAERYEKIVMQFGDISDSVLVIGDDNRVNVTKIYNNYFSDNFTSLSDYYKEPNSVFERVHVDDFVGREWLTAKVDDFLNDPGRKSGIFLLVGEAGVGKTAFMAHLVKERRYLHLFAEHLKGDANLQRAMQSLGSQLVTRYQIEPYKDHNTLPQLSVFPDFLEKLLRLAANTLAKGEQIVIVCDGLDEAGTALNGNVFGLPDTLPENVYLLLSQRPVSTKLPNFETHKETIEAQGPENLHDMETYLQAVVKRPEIAGQIRSNNCTDNVFIKTLKEKSLGVWMYLYYVIEEIGNGHRVPLDLETLPTGLVGYYAQYFNDWREGKNGRGEGPQKWDELYAPLLVTLAVAQEPVTIDQLVQWANINSSTYEIKVLLKEIWRAFLTLQDSLEGTLYSPYHASFRDFLTGKVDRVNLKIAESYLMDDLAARTREVNQRIVTVFKNTSHDNWPELVTQDYPRLHLTIHMAEAGNFDTLVNLLTEGNENIAWAEARYRKEGTYAGFINDLEYVWKFAQEMRNLALLIKCMLIENSIRSLAKNIPPILLSELAKMGWWSYPMCLTMISQIPDPEQQADAISQLVQNIPVSLLDQVISLARTINDKPASAHALSAIIPHLTDELKAQVSSEAISAAVEINDEFKRAHTFARIVPHLNEDFKNRAISEALSAARQIYPERMRTSTYIEIAPHLNEEDREQVLFEALSTARATYSNFLLVNDFIKISLYLKDKHRTQVLSEALYAAYKIDDDVYERALAFAAIASQLNDELKVEALSEAFSAAHEIYDESNRALAYARVAPYLNDELKTQAFSESLSAAQKINEEIDRAHTFVDIIPYLSEELKEQALSEAIAAVRKIRSEYNTAIIFTKLALYMSGSHKQQLLAEAIAAARKINDEFVRVQAFSAIAPHLRDELKQQLFSAINNINDVSYRARALIAIVPHLDDKLKERALSEILSAIREIKYAPSRVSTFVEIAPHLNDKLMEQGFLEALSSAREIKFGYDYGQALINMAPHLSDKLKVLLFSTVREIKDASTRARTFAGITPHLNAEFKEQAKSEAFSAAYAIEGGYDRESIFIMLANRFKGEFDSQKLAEAIRVTHDVDFPAHRADSLRALSHYFDGEYKEQVLSAAFAAALSIEDESERARIIAGLRYYLHGELRMQMFLATLKIKDASTRASTFNSIIPYLDDSLKGQAISEANSAAHQIKDETTRTLAFFALANHLEGEFKAQILSKAFFTAYKIKSAQTRAHTFAFHAHYLDDELKAQALSEALSAASEIEDESDRAQAFSAITPHLNDELKAKLLSIARQIEAESVRARVFSEIITHLNDELKEQLIFATREINDKSIRVRIFVNIRPYLNDDLKKQVLSDALSAAHEINDKSIRTHAFVIIAPYLNNDLKAQALSEALSAAREIKNDSTRARTFFTIAPHFEKETKIYLLGEVLLNANQYDIKIHEILTEWQKIEFEGLRESVIKLFKTISRDDRQKGLSYLTALVPALIHLEGNDISGEILRAISNTTRWWP